MPRKNPLPERERQICQRFMLIRRESARSRTEFGRQLNIDSSTLANLEHGRVRLAFYIAKRAGERFGVSMKWLAEGEGNRWGYQPVHDTLSAEARPFSQVYDEVIGPQLARRDSLAEELSMLRIYAKFPRAIGAPGEGATLQSVYDALNKELAQALGAELKEQVRLIPPGLRSALRLVVLQAVRDFITGLKSRHPPVNKIENKSLQPPGESPKTGGMTVLLPELLALLNKATERRGAKSALANDLGVSLPSLSQWLSGKREPGGEITLRLLKWVQQHRR